MPEIKNTFLKSKMNKDLDARLVPNGEYRDGKNISVSASEGSDVGALETVRGNIKVTDFGLVGDNLEIIGCYPDANNNRIYFFITNFSDSSIDSLSNISTPSKTVVVNNVSYSISGSNHYICYCEIPSFQNTFDVSNIVFKTLVTGTFLNFSKTHPILGINLLENLLFWTDNRNQPRKINVEKAINSPDYYNSEDNISVAKYAPFSSISFLKNTSGVAESTLINEKDEWLAPFFGLPGKIYDINGGTPPANEILVFGNLAGRLTDHLPTGVPPYDIRITSAGEPNKGEALARIISNVTVGDEMSLKTINGTNIPDISTTLGWQNGTFLFQLRNPNYNASFAGDKNLLENKFVRFSYRFKYDENDYSLSAPFSQHAFVPKQYGYFIGIDSDKTRQSSIVDFMENQVTTAGLVIDLPYSPSEIGEKLKVSEIQLLYKASDDENLKVIKDLKVEDVEGTIESATIKTAGSSYGVGTHTNISLSGGNGSGAKATVVADGAGRITSVTITASGEGYLPSDELSVPAVAQAPNPPTGSGALVTIKLSNTIIYNYSSEKPTKVLPEKEIVRVSDIVPLRAATQEIVGNRVIYGNFLQNKTTPSSLRYSVSKVNKGTNSPNVKKELINHNLKQNRSYQVGVVLQDRYGRSSNVILSENELSFNSSFFSNYSNGGVDPLTWGGDSMKVEFDELIPTEKRKNYNGIWDENENPLGWYSYKLVVKQQEQDYYNIYTAGNVSGNFDFEEWEIPLAYPDTESVSQIALFNDNINKVPRDLKEVGPSDNIYSSTTILYNRVKQTHRGSDNSPAVANVGEQNRNPSRIEITNVKPFREIGDWTTKKNIDMYYYLMGANGSTQITSPGTYIYPGFKGAVNPFFMKDNKNPLIANLKTNTRLGYTQTAQQVTTNADVFAKKLNVFETNPFESNIEIYYETSTSGLISEFNSSVEAGFGSPAPGGLTDVNIQFKESTTFPVDVSNTFQIVDTQNQPLNNATCEILNPPKFFTIDTIGNSNRVTGSSIPVSLQEVQAAALPSTPPTYKLVSNSIEIFNAQSSSGDRYLVQFTIRVSGFADITVEKEFKLTNVKPSIYKIMSSKLMYNLSNTPGSKEIWGTRNFVENGGLQPFLDSNEDSPIVVGDQTSPYATPYTVQDNYLVHSQYEINYGIDGPSTAVDGSSFDGGSWWLNQVRGVENPWFGVLSFLDPSIYETWRVASAYWSPLDICYFGFNTNGAGLITTFDEANDAKFSTPSIIVNTKNEGIIANVVSVDRYEAKYNKNDYKIYCTNTTPVNKTHDFDVKYIASGDPTVTTDSAGPIPQHNWKAITPSGGTYPVVYYKGGSFGNSDFQGSSFLSSWRSAYMYYIQLNIVDASGLTESITSSPYYVKFVIYNSVQLIP